MTARVPRRFVLNRLEDETGVSGVGLIAWGVEFPDGKVALRWNTHYSSCVWYDAMDAVVEIHGHGGKTRVDWIDE